MSRAKDWEITFDPNALQPWTSRPLNKFELLAIYVFLRENFNDPNGKTVRMSEPFKEVLAREINSLPELQQTLGNLSRVKRARKVRAIIDSLFVGHATFKEFQEDGSLRTGDLFEDMNKNIVTFIKRMCGIGFRDITKRDAQIMFDHVISEIVEKYPEIDIKNLKRDVFDEVAGQAQVIEEIGIPPRRADAVVAKLNDGNVSWRAHLAKRHNRDPEHAIKQKKGFTYEDIKAAYTKLTLKLRIEKDDENYIPTVEDIRAEYLANPDDGISVGGYYGVFERENKNITDLRIDCGIDNVKPVALPVRSVHIKWRDIAGDDLKDIRNKIIEVFLENTARVNNYDLDVNDHDDVRRYIADCYFGICDDLRDFNRTLDRHYTPEEMATRPTINTSTIKRYFGGFNQFYAAIEDKYECVIDLTKNPDQLNAFIGKADATKEINAQLEHPHAPQMVLDLTD